MIIAWIAAQAQVTPTGPFVGGYSEDFDAAPQTGAAIPCVEDTFGGVATVCAPDANVGGMQVRPSLFLGCEQDPRSAPHLASSNDGPAEIGGGAAFSRVGGWFGTHTTTGGELRIELFAADGALLLQDTSPFAGTCQWEWRGWASVTPIARMRITRTAGDGALTTLDDLELDLACGIDDLDCDGSLAAADCDDRDALRTPGAPELCDGLDNNCDEDVPAGEVDADADGWLACEECADGDAQIHPTAEDDCDGVDDDCDGVDGSNPTSPVPPASLQGGVCAGAVQACVSGAWTEPDYGSFAGFEPTEASCDGVDNDCDGAIDADLTPPPVDGGLGVCGSLRPTCEGALGWVDPSERGPTWEPEETLCDGLDNDCDGELDEGEGPPALLQLGVCDGAVQLCNGGDWVEPNYSDLDGFDPVEVCDALDNDCDGTVDDDCIKEKSCATGPGSASAGLMLLGLGLLRTRRR